MQQPTREVLEALAKVKQLPQGQRVLQWLRDSLDDELKTGLRTDGEDTRKAQGRGLILLEILDLFDNSEHFLARVDTFSVRSEQNKDRNLTV